MNLDTLESDGNLDCYLCGDVLSMSVDCNRRRTAAEHAGTLIN